MTPENDFSDTEIEAGRRLFAGEWGFLSAASSVASLPPGQGLEVAFAGRSNVGKSSLINALLRQRLARTSAAPGKTRLANIFRVQRGTRPPFHLVDLPGYGYARGGDASVRAFDELTRAYFRRGQ
ncbi:MAG TPA: GTPase, partial [Chloroflexota bacterium]|nr:GTPase [Chloroflexota bacterium]